MRLLTIAIVLFGLIRVIIGYAYVKHNFSLGLQMIAINSQISAAVVGCIYNFEDVSTYQFIISIDCNQNLSFFAISMNAVVEVGHMILPVLISDKSNFLPKLLILQLLLQSLNSLVFGCIIDNDNVVIRVVLLSDGVEVEEIPESLIVFVSGYYNTHR